MRIDVPSAYQTLGFLTQAPKIVHARADQPAPSLDAVVSRPDNSDRDFHQAQVHNRIYAHAATVSSAVVGLLESTPDL